MKVLIDEGLSTLQQLGGIGYQSYCIWEHLRKYIDCNITNYRYLRYLPRVLKRAIYLGMVNMSPNFQKYDIIHYQNYYTPRYLGKSRGLTTIHDLGVLVAPDLFPVWYNAYFRKTIRQTIERSDAIILVSHSVRNQILSYFPKMDRSKAYVCLNGLRPIFFDFNPAGMDLPFINLRPFSYFLFVGNLEKRKNLHLLIDKFLSARKHSLIANETKLVLVGKYGVMNQDISTLISEKDNIIYLGRINDEKLVVLYRYCKAFIFPSLLEGFGIPIIEAMSQGAPILISDIPSNIELNDRHNKQCFIFELGKEESIVDRLSYLDKYYYEVRSKLNYGNLSIYSYDTVAQEYIKVYKNIL